jgi:hypothetical protein
VSLAGAGRCCGRAGGCFAAIVLLSRMFGGGFSIVVVVFFLGRCFCRCGRDASWLSSFSYVVVLP